MPEQPRSKVRAILLAAALLLLALAVACGAAATGTPEPTATPTPEPTATPAATATPDTGAGTTDATPEAGATPKATAYAPAALGTGPELAELRAKYPFPPPVPPWPPRKGGVLHMPTNPKPDLDPMRTYDTESLLIYDRLLEWEAQWYDPEVQTTPTIRKNLAESWEMVDLSTWDFKLKQGVMYQDLPPVNGRELVAEDVKYSYDQLKDVAGWSTGMVPVESVEALDKHRVRINLNLPLSGFPRLHTDGFSPAIFPREAAEASGGLRENAVGSGPFILEEFVPGEGALLVRNPNYHMRDRDGTQLPYLDGVRLIFTRDQATEAALYRAEQLDMMNVTTLDMLLQILETNPDTWLYRIPSFGWTNYQVFMNLDEEPFNNVKVRQALSMAINRDVVAEVINRGDAALYGPFPWALAGFNDFSDYTYQNLGPNYQYNPERAKELLAEAGYPEGFQTELTLEFGEYRAYPFEDVATLVAKYFDDIGVEVNIKQVETTVFNSKRYGVEPIEDMLITFGASGSGPTAWDWIYQMYHSSSPPTVNTPHVEDPKVDALLNEWTTSSPERRLEIHKELWDYLTEQVYRITTIVPPHYRITQPYLHAGANPYCWFRGFCTYEAKTAWMTQDAPERQFERFGQ